MSDMSTLTMLFYLRLFRNRSNTAQETHLRCEYVTKYHVLYISKQLFMYIFGQVEITENINIHLQ